MKRVMVVCFMGFRQFGQGSSVNRMRGLASSFRARRGHSKGSNLDCKGLVRFATAPQSNRMVRRDGFHVEP